MSVIIKSGNSTDLMTVDSNKSAQVVMPLDESLAGFAALTAEVDSGSVTGSRLTRALEANEDYVLRVGVDNLIFAEHFNGTTVNAGQWLQTLNNMTVAQANGYLTLNNTGATTNGYYAIVNSYKTAPFIGTQTTYIQFMANIEYPSATNKIMEIGVGYAATTAAPTDGVFFRWGADGTLKGVVNNNGSEILSTNPITPPTTATTHNYLIALSWQAVEFWIDDILQSRIVVPVANGQATRSSAFPFVARVYNSGGSASNAPKINLSDIVVTINGAPLNRPYPMTRASFGENCNTGCTTFTTLGTQSNWTNSPTIGSFTLTNGFAPTGTNVNGATLGGLFQFAAQAGAVTDFQVYTYQVPAGSVSVTGKTLYITDIRIDCINTGAAVAGTATVMHWALAFGGSAIDLATADAATTKAGRRMPLGTMGWIVGAAIGTAGNPIAMNLMTPIPVYQGQYLQIIEQTVIGTATGSEVFRGSVSIGGFWE